MKRQLHIGQIMVDFQRALRPLAASDIHHHNATETDDRNRRPFLSLRAVNKLAGIGDFAFNTTGLLVL